MLCLLLVSSVLVLHSFQIINRPVGKFLAYSSLDVEDLINPSNFRKWYEMNECQVLLAEDYLVPKAIVHFVGGFLAGSGASIAYGPMLHYLSKCGFLIVTTPYEAFNTNHTAVAATVSLKFRSCFNLSLRPLLGDVIDEVPVIGLSHSLGGKLNTILCSRKEDRKLLPERAANIFLAFNNYGMKDSSDVSSKQAWIFVEKIFPELRNSLNSFRK